MRKYFLFSLLFAILTGSANAASVNVVEHFWIPLSDGTRLAVRMWLPEDSDEHPVPAILNYIPYRKRDGTRGRDDPMMSWWASHGYACLRVDMRGSGESDGFLDDEYLPIEQQDAVEVIDWISRQTWCTGAVGMMGKSWGGFNVLEVAALRPPALKAIISVCSTDDRYADDIHYMGGCLLNDNLWWGAIMVAYQARPADPELRGDDWRDQWLERIAHMPFWPALWLKQQRRNDYWRQGSICEDWNAIQCPVLLAGGWADAYSNAIPRMLEHLQAPRIGLIGPWAHVYAQDGLPGPAIGFMQESNRFWDQWLKGEETGIMKEPMLRAYIEEWSPPSGWRNPAPGRWVGEQEWPSKNIEKKEWCFSSYGLVDHVEENSELSVCSPLWVGSTAGEFMGCGVPGEMAVDQRIDDGCSLVFDTEPLKNRLEVLGAPELVLYIASDKPVAQICARLCDVAPDGSSRRFSYQMLNLTHRDSHSDPQLLEPGCVYRVVIKLNDCGYAIEQGHSIRVALSTAYWPLIWPSPTLATLTIHTSGSRLYLPVRPPRIEDTFIRFEPPLSGLSAPITKISDGKFERVSFFDILTGTAHYVTNGQGGLFGEGVLRYEEIGTALSHNLKRSLSIRGDDPLSACYVLTQTYTMDREGWNIRIESQFEMTSTESEFHLSGVLDVYEESKKCANRIFDETIPRDCL